MKSDVDAPNAAVRLEVGIKNPIPAVIDVARVARRASKSIDSYVRWHSQSLPANESIDLVERCLPISKGSGSAGGGLFKFCSIDVRANVDLQVALTQLSPHDSAYLKSNAYYCDDMSHALSDENSRLLENYFQRKTLYNLNIYVPIFLISQDQLIEACTQAFQENRLVNLMKSDSEQSEIKPIGPVSIESIAPAFTIDPLTLNI